VTRSASGIPGHPGLTTFLGGVASAATAIVVVGFTVALFANPLWIGFEQERAGVPAITGYTPEQVRSVTGSILADVIFGPPAFTATVNGQAVLDAAERSHMVDVHNVLRVFGGVVGLAILTLVLIVWTNRGRGWTWRAIGRGSGALAIVGVVVGVAVLFFFDAAFLLFHLVFFPQGNFTFDPRTQRLTQLFPDQFWTETSIGVAIVGLAVAVAVTQFARRRAARLRG
jgi:integral membrane protein (TIGR01906 family)